MGKYIVKTGDDEYIEFSTVVDSPTTYFCTRQEMIDMLNEPRRGQYWMREDEIERLMADVDERLTSSHIGAPPKDYDEAVAELVESYNNNKQESHRLTVEQFREEYRWKKEEAS